MTRAAAQQTAEALAPAPKRRRISQTAPATRNQIP